MPAAIEPQQKHVVEFGDFQTPMSLAIKCCQVVAQQFDSFQTVIEPTCGIGAFLVAATNVFPAADLRGYEINAGHLAKARKAIRATSSSPDQWQFKKRDFFATDWERERTKYCGKVLFLGNPPWVTNSGLGAMDSSNTPAKTNIAKQRGIDAMTGRSNFDLSEAIIQTLLETMVVDQDVLAMLIKTSTARRIIKQAWSSGVRFGHLSLHPIDAQKEFGVSADACMLMAQETSRTTVTQLCRQSSQLGKVARRVAIAHLDGILVSDPQAAKATACLSTNHATPWRSGVKHDLSRVMELKLADGQLVNSKGDLVDIENDLVFPLAKGADVANGRTECRTRRILMTQRTMADNTDYISTQCPRTWSYLQEHRAEFGDRKSSIYRNRDPFALFGIGEYTFARWKVAVCGLYKRLQFSVFGPVNKKPVILDDTCYFLSFRTRKQAELVAQLLHSESATRFLESRIFWDAKRPITASLLRQLDLEKVADQENEQQAFAKLGLSKLLSKQ